VDGDCGEDGANLSGGQKQRIALARALIRGIHFLILDEGVSAIDVQTANEIERQLLDRRDVTLLTITHRIKDGLLDRYDRVVQMP
jgi:ATP-binding cassette subfamily C protein